MEWSPGYMKDLNFSEQEMFDLIHELGYEIRLKGFDGKVILSYIDASNNLLIPDFENIYLTRVKIR